MTRIVTLLIALSGCAATPAPSGSSMPLNMAPAPPEFATKYDFDLLTTLRGEKCINRSALVGHVYWTASFNIDKMPDDELTRAAINGAAYEAANSLEGVDAFIVTRVLATARDADTVCAKVFGRGLRLKKHEPASAQ
jgi:hypothetical protein